jgi:ketopantoate hydroxymethyltransferase
MTLVTVPRSPELQAHTDRALRRGLAIDTPVMGHVGLLPQTAETRGAERKAA